MHIKARPGTLGDDLRDRSMPTIRWTGSTRGHLAKEYKDMTVLMISAWLALQLPTGILLGRFLERQPLLVPVRARR
jgi:hypothetical protein